MRHQSLRWIGILLQELLSSGVASVARSVEAFYQESVHELLEEALASVRRSLRLYGALLSLAILAVLSLGAALTEGLTALGLPSWASHLTVGVLVAGAAVLVSSRLEKPPMAGREIGEAGAGSLFTVNIGRPVPSPKKGGKARRSRSRPRGRRRVEVRLEGDAWEVRSSRNPRVKEVFPTQREALARALDVARREGAEVLISSKTPSGAGPFQGVA